MALLEIMKAGDPVLKQEAAKIEKVTAKHRKLLDSMAQTMYAAEGVGLAAPQVGQSICCVVIDVGDDNGLLELINPEIVAREGSEVGQEGCLSVPNIFGDVERAAKVTVEFTNRWNKRKKLTAGGLLARCIQHEMDHLQGTLFIDKAKSLRTGDADEKSK